MLSVNRLDRAKRIDVLIEAAAVEPSLQRRHRRRRARTGSRLEALARDRGVDGRVRFAGRVPARELADLYATCFATFYAPVDEDFGLGPYESFLSGKPVITATDAGGPLEVVRDGSTGRVVAPDAGARSAAAAVWLREHPVEARRTAEQGRRSPSEVTWDRAIGRLLS